MNRVRLVAMSCALALVLAPFALASCAPSGTAGKPTEQGPNRLPAVSSAQEASMSAGLDTLMKAMDMPGAVVAVTRPGAADVTIVKGMSDVASGTAMAATDSVRIGSITKTFTSTVLLQLAGEGKVSLDDPVSKFFPKFPNGASITVRMLLNHTSGIYSYTESPVFLKRIKTDPLAPFTPEQLIAIGAAGKPYFKPASAFDYSNTAYIMAGRIIEMVSGDTYGAQVQRRVIEPLGLTHTYLPSSVEMTGTYSHGYTYDLGGGRKDITRQQVPTWGWAAGGLVSDLADLQKCAVAFGTGSLLTEPMRKEYFSWTPMPTKPGTPPTAYTGLGIGKVFGWIGNTGGTYGYTTWMWYVPDTKATVVALFNETSTFTPEIEVKEQTALGEFLANVIGNVK